MKENKKILKRKERGITLIALVITIIVLLILAGVSISMLTGDNGILTQAQNAKEKTEQSSVEEIRKLTQSEAITHLQKYEYEDVSGKKITIPAQCAVSQVEGENTLSDGLVIIDANGNEWVWIEVPESEMPSGLTFENDMDYETLETALQTYTKDYRKTGFTDVWYKGCGLEEGEYIALKQSMLKSIYDNKGFYIGRYEVGIEEDTNRNFGVDYSIEHPLTETPVIKSNKYVYNWITCSQAQELAERLAPKENTSSLMFGLQWDLVLKYLENNGVSVSELKENSTSWGNYTDSEFEITKGKYSEHWGVKFDEVKDRYLKLKDKIVLLTTGATERNSKMNIFDFAGNAYERTLEKCDVINSPTTYRGGAYGYKGTDRPASFREENFANFNESGIGFRPALW